MILKLNQAATGAAWSAMREVSCKGRSAVRMVSRIQKALRVNAMQANPEELADVAKKLGVKPEEMKHEDICDKVARFSFVGGEVELSEEQFEFFTDAVDEIVEKGLPGERGAAFGDLVEAISILEKDAK